MDKIILLLSFIMFSCEQKIIIQETPTLKQLQESILDIQLVAGAYQFSNDTHAKNCLEYKNYQNYQNQGDGFYWIDPDGLGGQNEIKAKCDMTSNGGGWTLVSSRAGILQNIDACGTNLNEFIQTTCGNVENTGFAESYNIGNSQLRANLIEMGQWYFVQYDNSDTPDLDDAYIIKHDKSDLFIDDPATLYRTLVTEICDANNSNCDNTDVYFLWIGDGWFNNANCQDALVTGPFRGNYGYCHNGLANYLANSLFGNRESYNETKLWNHGNGAQNYKEEIWIR